MATPIRQFIDGPYGQMHLRRTAACNALHRPLICLHMFPQSGRNFERLLSIVPEGRLVIAPDFPGYGESTAPPEPITAQEYAASIWTLIDQLGLLSEYGAIDLFGIHAGAKLAVEIAAQRPDDVNRIVLSSAAVLYSKELDALRSIFTPIPLDDEGTRFRHLWKLLVQNRSEAMSYEMMGTSFAEMLRGGEGYEWGHQAVFEYNSVFPHVIKSLPHPIALLNPGDDLKAMTPRTVKYIQNGVFFEFPKWKQGFLEANAEDLWAVVSNHLDGPHTNARQMSANLNYEAIASAQEA